MPTYFGFNPPFLTPESVLPTQYDERLIKNDLLQLLLTSPGERVMRPDFGTELRKFPFEQMDRRSLDRLESSIKVAIERFEERVLFKKLTIVKRPDQNGVIVSVQVALTIDPNIILAVEVPIQNSQISSKF